MKEEISPKVGKYNEEKRFCSQCGKPLSGWNKTNKCYSHGVSDAESTTLESRLKNAQMPMTKGIQAKSIFGTRTPPGKKYYSPSRD